MWSRNSILLFFIKQGHYTQYNKTHFKTQPFHEVYKAELYKNATDGSLISLPFGLTGVQPLYVYKKLIMKKITKAFVNSDVFTDKN